MAPSPRRGAPLLLTALCGAALAACAPAGTGQHTIRIGAIFPLTGAAAPLASEELQGAQIAVDMANAQGGALGLQLSLDVRDVSSTSDVTAAVQSLRRDGVDVTIGAYSSELSIPAAAAAARAGMVYWETGAVADQLTAQRLPAVFRVGPDGADLGGTSAAFTLNELAPRLGLRPSAVRVYLVTADDDYARSVAAGVRSGLRGSGATVVGESLYDPYAPRFSTALHSLAAERPDVVMLSAHIPDGIAFRRAFLAAGIHVRAFIGTTMAQCVPDFGRELGTAAYGVFASDRPDGAFNPQALQPAARSLYASFSRQWQQRTGAMPDEEAIAGFSATWVLVHDVLPASRSLQPQAVAAAAQALDLPAGSLPNGGGVRFATSGPQDGQNLRAAATVDEWGPGGERAVWPAQYATGAITLSPAAS